jgi:intein/homing endonuclease
MIYAKAPAFNGIMSTKFMDTNNVEYGYIQIIVNLLRNGSKMSLASIIEKSGKTKYEVKDALSILLCKGYIIISEY